MWRTGPYPRARVRKPSLSCSAPRCRPRCCARETSRGTCMPWSNLRRSRRALQSSHLRRARRWPSRSRRGSPASRQFLQGALQLLVARNRPMPFKVVLHEADAFPHHRAEDDDARPGFRGSAESLQNPADIVAVRLDDMPAEGAELVRERLQGEHLLGAASLLLAVAVDECGEIAELVVRSRHKRLPARALLELSVAEGHENPSFPMVQPIGEREPHRGREALSKTASRKFRQGKVDVRGMSLQ